MEKVQNPINTLPQTWAGALRWLEADEKIRQIAKVLETALDVSGTIREVTGRGKACRLPGSLDPSGIPICGGFA